MTSSGPDRSIASMSLPQWMKSKISDRYDLEQTAFSPPSTDDGFFLVKYKKAIPEQSEQQPQVTTSKHSSPLKQAFENNSSENSNNLTNFYQKFIPTAAISPREIGMRHGVDSSLSNRFKSTGTDETASCGYSVVAVAHQMIAERTGEKLEAPQMNQRIRRNSKSLPASPQTSPKLLRKNPYFTNIIFGSTEGVDSNENQSSSSVMRGSVEELGKWGKVNRNIEIDSTSLSSTNTTALLHQHRQYQQQQQLQQQQQIGQLQQQQQQQQSITTLSTAATSTSSSSRQFFTPSPPTPPVGGGFSQVVTLKAKPSHLREMNFWSPTSM